MSTYRQKQDYMLTKKIRTMLEDLPKWVQLFFRGKADSTTVRTRYAYVNDIRIFLDYLSQHVFNIPLMEIELKHLDKVTALDIEGYMEHLTIYAYNGAEQTNTEQGKFRKLASLRSVYGYYVARDLITHNPASKVAAPTLYEKEIESLTEQQIDLLLGEVVKGKKGKSDPKNKFSSNMAEYWHEQNGLRDLAIIYLLLGTGLRVSECAGINETDLNFELNSVKVIRKGGKQQSIYFSDEVAEILLDYMEQKIEQNLGTQDKALFVSNRNTRASVRTLQHVVKKYSKDVVSEKGISPHKLRSTYGTHLYATYGDVYLVADVLGHANVDTTKKHYAKMSEENRQKASSAITFDKKNTRKIK